MTTGVDSERADERLRTLTRAMRTFAEASTDLDELFERVAKIIVEALGDSCVLFALSDDGDRLVPAAANAVEPHVATEVLALLRTTPYLLAAHPEARHVVETRSTLLVPKIDQVALSASSDGYVVFQRELGVHSVLLIALHSHGQPLGLLTLARYRATSPSFEEADRELAQNLSDHASLAIANARLYAAERRARVAAEAAVQSQREAEARFALLADAGILGILVGRLDGTIVHVNPYIEQMLGYSCDALLSGTVRWASLTPPEYAPVDIRARHEIDTKGVASVREKELVRANGTRVPVLLASARVSGGPDIVSFIVDLSDRKHTEAALERMRAERAIDAQFRAVVEAAPDAIVVTDAAGAIVMVNAQTEQLFSDTREGLLGRTIVELLAERGIDDGPELFGRRSDGSEFPLEMSVSMIDTGRGQLTVRAMRDVTHRREAERELLRAKESAEAANRELESFSYSVAHDLRAPLRAMNGFARLVLAEYGARIGEEGESYLRQIATSATDMAALIDGLLALARLSRAPVSREPIDLSALARASAARALADTSGPQYEVTVEDGLRVDADPTLVRALLDNLASNAVKFSGQSAEPRIHIGLVEREGAAVFFVRDNGVGFEMEYAHKLFAPFQRLHAASEFAGSGIGLATAQRIVLRHGGRIWAESTVGQGATFFFTLPDEH